MLTGIDHNVVHRIPWPNIQLIFRLFGGEGCGRSGRTNRFRQLCRCIVVGCYNGDDYRLRWHRAANMDGQNCCIVFQRVRDIVFCTASGECNRQSSSPSFRCVYFVYWFIHDHICSFLLRLTYDVGHSWVRIRPESTTKTTTETFQSANTGGGHADTELVALLCGRQVLP